MVKRKKYLWQHPSGRWYVRKKGQYHRISSPAGTAEFDFEYWEILRGRRSDAKRSWTALITILRQSKKWAGFSPRYRKDLEPVLQYLEEKIGKRDVSKLTPSDIYTAMDANQHRVRFANYIPTTISLLAKIAKRKNWRSDNPAADIELLTVPEDRRKPHLPWTNEGVRKWRDEAEPLPLLIFEIGVGSVQRPGDWSGFTWRDYDGENLRLTQNKTGLTLLLPCTAQLKMQLDRAKAALPTPPHPTRPILANDDGSAMSYFKIARIMREERQRLGLLKHDLHALRYRGVKELAYAGCDDDEIASYTGHMTTAMIKKYAGEARQEMRARSASEKRRKA